MDQIDLDLSAEQIQGITSFLGYGKPAHSIWFIGLEEGWGKSSESEARENLKPRGDFQPVMDLYEAHQGLKEQGVTINIKAKASFTPVWVYMAKIMIAKEGHKNWSDNAKNREEILDKAKEFIRYRLGRWDGNTFLTELSPIPRKRTSDSNWMQAFRRIAPSLDEQIQNRKATLKRLLGASQ